MNGKPVFAADCFWKRQNGSLVNSSGEGGPAYKPCMSTAGTLHPMDRPLSVNDSPVVLCTRQRSRYVSAKDANDSTEVAILRVACSGDSTERVNSKPQTWICIICPRGGLAYALGRAPGCRGRWAICRAPHAQCLPE